MSTKVMPLPPATIPPEIMLHVFEHLESSDCFRTLAAFRRVSKSTYLQATPFLVRQRELSLASLIQEAYYADDHAESEALRVWGTFFENTTTASWLRRKNDLSFLKTLILSSLTLLAVSSGCGTHAPNPPDILTTSSHSFLHRLRTVIIDTDTIHNLTSGPMKLEGHPSALSALRLSALTELIIRYPSEISGSLPPNAKIQDHQLCIFIRLMMKTIPSLELVAFQNLHFQPIPLCLPGLTLKTQIITFGRHSKCPDMGGALRRAREDQITASLSSLWKGMAENVNGDNYLDPSLVKTRYVFINAIGSIPQWEGAEDVTSQAKTMMDSVHKRMKGNFNGFNDEVTWDHISLVENEFSM